MGNIMNHKGYKGRVTYDDEAKMFHGEVIGIQDVITFQGKTVSELQSALEGSIDDYLVWCRERGEKPEKAFSGNISICISSELHAQLAENAATKGLSLDLLILEKLQK